MKRFLLTVLFLLSGLLSWGQCPTFPAIITSQAVMDNFQNLYPNCTQFTHTLIVDGNITNLDGLSEATAFNDGLILVGNLALENIDGLSNVTYMSRFFMDNSFVDNLDALSQVTGLDGLTLIRNSELTNVNGLSGASGSNALVRIEINDVLVNLDGLEGFTSTMGISIENNPLLENLDGLSNVTSNQGDIEILNNESLVHTLGLSNLDVSESFPGSPIWIWINNNPVLEDIGPMINSAQGTFRLTIHRNPMLQSLIGLSPIVNTTSLSIFENTTLTSLEGLQNIETVSSTMFVGSNINVENFNALQNIQLMGMDPGLRSNVISNQPLITSLEGIFAPNTVIQDGGFQVSFMPGLANLNGLESIVEIQSGDFTIRNNDNLLNIDAFSNTSFGMMEGVRLSDNPQLSSFGPLSGLNEIKDGLRIENNDLITSLNGLDNIIESETPPQFGSEQYRIIGNELLTDISALSGLNFEFIGEDFELTISDNTNLAECNIISVCNLLGGFGDEDVTIENNAVDCNSLEEVFIECNLDANIITGTTFYDFASDGCSADDFPAPNVLVEITDGVDVYNTLTKADGSYLRFTDVEGLVTTSVVAASLPQYFNVSPESQETTFVGLGNEAIIDFCITPLGAFNDLQISLIAFESPRPGFDNSYKLIYENVGTTVQSGTVTLQFDTLRQTFLNALPVPDDVTTNIITWDIPSLQPFETGEIDVELNILPPPANNIGDIIRMEGRLAGDEGDESPVNNRSVLEQEVVGSFDPNDKLVAQGKFIFEDEIDNYLNYVVRFQNTGTAEAKKVIITDELSAKLDWNSLRMLDASHDYRVEISEGNAVAFVFEDIDLPPEVDDPEGSNGYVAFQLKPSEDIQLNDFIFNTANIFFDFNPPIITNTATTQYVANPSDCPDNVIVLSTQLQVDNFESDFEFCDIQNVDIKINGPDIINLEGLQSLSVIGGKLTIIDNPLLSTLSGIGNLEFIGENAGLLIENNDSLNSLTNLQGLLNGDLGITISNNPSLLSLAGFEGVLASENVIISNNSGLVNLDGLSGITDIDGVIEIVSNNVLDDINGLEGVDPFNLNSWTITANVNLSVCNLTSLCSFLEIDGEAIISNNASGCASEEEIRSSCGLLSTPEFDLNEALIIVPNPVSDILKIEISNGLELKKVIVYSVLGAKIMETTSLEISFSSIPKGLYFIAVETNQGTLVKRLLKE